MHDRPVPEAVPAQPASGGGTEPLIEAVGMRKKYCRDLRRSLRYGVQDVFGALLNRRRDAAVLRPQEFWAVDGVSFKLHRGESLGLLGHNGSGKSTLLKLVTGQRRLTAGHAVTRGRIVALTELGLGFDPSLTGRENIYVNAALFGVSRRQVNVVLDDIIAFAGIAEFIDAAVGTYSSGMKARLGFATAMHLEPDILLVDEVLAVGDMAFRRKCIQSVGGYLQRGGSLVLVAHDPYLIQSVCTRSIVMDKGRIIFAGTAIEGVRLHFEVGHDQQRVSETRAALRTAAAGTAHDREPIAVAPAVVGPQAAADLPETAGGQAACGRARRSLSAERPVLLDGLEIRTDSDGPLVTGAAAKVVLRYRSRVAMEASWGFSLCTADLQNTITQCTKGMDGNPTLLSPGEHSLVCLIPRLPLRPGTYAIRGGLAELPLFGVLDTIGYDDSPGFFTVLPAETSRASNVQMMTNSLVDIEVDWLG